MVHIWRTVTIVAITFASGGKGGGRGFSMSSKQTRSIKEMIAAIVLTKNTGNGGGKSWCPSMTIF